jgi:hypothetical protein
MHVTYNANNGEQSEIAIHVSEFNSVADGILTGPALACEVMAWGKCRANEDPSNSSGLLGPSFAYRAPLSRSMLGTNIDNLTIEKPRQRVAGFPIFEVIQ